MLRISYTWIMFRHVGRRLYTLACQLDLEGIVAKRIDLIPDVGRWPTLLTQ